MHQQTARRERLLVVQLALRSFQYQLSELLLKFRRRAVMKESLNLSLTDLTDCRYLLFPWSRTFCGNRKFEVLFRKLRCRIPTLHYYLRRSGVASFPQCSHCDERDTLGKLLAVISPPLTIRKTYFKKAISWCCIEYIDSRYSIIRSLFSGTLSQGCLFSCCEIHN